MKKVKSLTLGGKVRILILAVLLVIIVILGVLIYKKNVAKDNWQNSFAGLENVDLNSMGMGEENISDTVLAAGVTSVGMISENFPIESLSIGLEVEEVLIAAGEKITGETAVLKFSEESVQEARAELETALREADLAYRAGKIEYEQAVISAEYDYQSAVLAGEHAEAVYQETISNMEENVEKTRTAFEEAKAEITAYETAIANGTYSANLEKYRSEYDSNYNLLVSTMEEWGFAWTDVTNARGGNGWGATTREQYLKAAQNLYSVLSINEKYLTEAEEEYDEKVTSGSFYLQTLQLSLPELEEAYATAMSNYETSLVKAKLTKETALTEAELAKKSYETNLEKAESDFTILEEAYHNAEEDLAVFEAQIGTGYYYPTEAGTVLRISIREGREVTAGSTLFTLSDYSEMTVTVSVDQADIAKLAVGDSAIVYSEESGTAQGTISSINPVSGSSNKTSITYSVTVEMTGNTTQFATNESVYVYFMVGGSDE